MKIIISWSINFLIVNKYSRTITTMIQFAIHNIHNVAIGRLPINI